MTDPTNPDKKSPSKGSCEKETGILTERVDLPVPEEEQTQKQAEEQTLLPHERDQTTRPVGTSLPNETEQGHTLIGQAAEDTEHGLKDTDRRGIPSDIVASKVPASDVPVAKRKKKR